MIDEDIFNNEAEEVSSVIVPQTPKEIPRVILRRIFTPCAVPLIMALIIFLSHFIFPDFNYIHLMLAALILALIGGFTGMSLYFEIMTYGYVKLEGTITRIDTEKFDKNSKIIQIQDDENEDFLLSFRYSGNRNVIEGTPVVLYLSALAQIEDKDDTGPYTDGYLSVSFSTENLASEEGKVSAMDFFRRK